MKNKIEVLVSTIDLEQNEDDLFKSMNINIDATIWNQSSFQSIFQSNKTPDQKIISDTQRGIGLSRNKLILNSKADICVLADDDMIFKDNFEFIVQEQFLKHPDADVLLFNLGAEGTSEFSNTTKINRLNYTKYGAARFAFRRKSIINNDIFFTLLFGGGALFGSGEDTIFLKDCLSNKLRIYGVNATIADLYGTDNSTWFDGYNEKFFKDKGSLFYRLNKYLFFINALQFSFRKHSLSKGEIGFLKAFILMYAGSRNYKNRQ